MSETDTELKRITDTVSTRLGNADGIGARLKCVIQDAGVVFIDGTATPNQIHNRDEDADCTLTVSLETFSAILDGSLDPTTAFMQGQIKLDGDMSVAMKLGPMLSS